MKRLLIYSFGKMKHLFFLPSANITKILLCLKTHCQLFIRSLGKKKVSHFGVAKKETFFYFIASNEKVEKLRG